MTAVAGAAQNNDKWGSYLHKAGFTLGGLHTQLKKCCRHIGWTIMIHYDHPIGMQHFMKLSLSAIILHSYYYYFLFNLGYFYFSTRYFNKCLLHNVSADWRQKMGVWRRKTGGSCEKRLSQDYLLMATIKQALIHTFCKLIA